jgi:hypothetical protein
MVNSIVLGGFFIDVPVVTSRGCTFQVVHLTLRRTGIDLGMSATLLTSRSQKRTVNLDYKDWSLVDQIIDLLSILGSSPPSPSRGTVCS